MKALILAAGKGSRLKDIAGDIPKPMLTFRGKPILEHNIELCRKYGVTDLMINTHTFPEKIKNYFGNGKNFGVKISYSYEEELLGTAGAINHFKDQIGKNDFYVIYGDNFSGIDLNALEQNFVKHTPVASIAFHYRKDTAQSGVAEFDKNGRILKFIEKPKPGESDSHWVNAGVYLLSNSILQYIPAGFSDYGKDIFPLLLDQDQPLYGICQESDVLAFDTPEMYHKNQTKS